MSKKVDINVDIGEGLSFDEALLDFATSANVCCGEHAGSWELTQETIHLCRLKGVRIGIHPGYPDRESMGRAMMQEDEVKQYANSLFEQTLRFWSRAPDAGYLKPHGAWYNLLVEPSHPAPHLYQAGKLILDGILGFLPLPAMLLAGSSLARSLSKEGVSVLAEGFGDRRYEADGTLRSRRLSDAVLTEAGEIRDQVLRLAELVDSICIHGDTPDCVEIARLVYTTLEEGGFEVGF